MSAPTTTYSIVREVFVLVHCFQTTLTKYPKIEDKELLIGKLKGENYMSNKSTFGANYQSSAVGEKGR